MSDFESVQNSKVPSKSECGILYYIVFMELKTTTETSIASSIKVTEHAISLSDMNDNIEQVECWISGCIFYFFGGFIYFTSIARARKLCESFSTHFLY